VTISIALKVTENQEVVSQIVASLIFNKIYSFSSITNAFAYPFFYF
jgi:hypothetical protein